MKILLIAGHGAGQPGACGNGYKEVDLTREVVNILEKKLKQYATVDVYDQRRNAFCDVQDGKFKIGKYDYVLEVHFNASNGKGHGTEIYVTTRENGISVEQAIMKNMSKFFTLRDNDSIFDGVKRTNFLVINTVKSRGMSGALLETCFIDNKSDIEIYQKNKDAICQAICDGIVSGFGLKKKTISSIISNTVSSVVSNVKTSVTKTNIKVGSKVTLLKSAKKYATGQAIPSWVKGKKYTIMQVGNSKVLLKEIYSWVYTKDIR